MKSTLEGPGMIPCVGIVIILVSAFGHILDSSECPGLSALLFLLVVGLLTIVRMMILELLLVTLVVLYFRTTGT